MSDAYEVRQARIDDWPLISSFIARCYGRSAAYKQEERWRWQFLDAPDADEAEGMVPVWIALNGGGVAGQIALQPARFWLEGTPHAGGWIVDVMIAPEHRGVGLGHRIHDAIKASGRVLFTLTMAEATRRIADKAGCVTLNPVHQMVRVRRLSGRTVADVAGPLFARRPKLRGVGRTFVGSRTATALVGGAASLASSARRALLSAVDTADVRPVERIDTAAADRVFARMTEILPALFDRSGAWCRWRFDEAPVLRYRRAALHRDGEVQGFVVWRLPERPELNFGTLTTLIADPRDEEGLLSLAAHAVRAMERETEAIVAGASDPRFVSVLRRLGFVTVKRHHPTVVTEDQALAAAIAAQQWHFDKADHDWDQVHPVEEADWNG